MKIFTYLSKAARRLFPQADDDLLERLEDDGLLVEPRHYVPVLPLLLVNGAQVRMCSRICPRCDVYLASMRRD